MINWAAIGVNIWSFEEGGIKISSLREVSNHQENQRNGMKKGKKQGLRE